MRIGYFLALPVAATALNLLFASFLVVVFHPRKAQAQLQPGNFENLRLGFRPTEPEPYLTLEEESRTKSLQDAACHETPNEDDEKDPMLHVMPIDKPPYYVDVYKRADISSFYRESPGSRNETKPAFKGQAGKFINISPHRVTLYWEDDHGKAFFIANVGPWENGGTASFPSHKFHFQRRDTKEVVCRFLVQAGTSLYYCDPFVEEGDDTNCVAKQGKHPKGFTTQSLDSLKDHDMDRYEEHRFNLKFATQYKNFTGGSEWLAHYPSREAGPLHKIWRADYFGQEHVVQSYETQFQEIPQVAGGLRGNAYAVKRNSSADIAFPEYRMPGMMNITIKAVSGAPRAFQIDNFLSDAEVDHLLDVVQGKYSLKRSTTGTVAGIDESEMSETRTSKNTWLPRTASPVLDAVYRRVADALRLDEALLRKRAPNEPMPREASNFGEEEQRRSLEPINEQMQIVHYDKTEEYTAHHDFGYTERASRSINFCIYLNEGMRGGETSFPRWRNAETTKGMNMVPEKGKAMIFYMVNPDGNLDDLTQHAALPVLEGEKWFSNLWIWDPFRV